MSKKRKVHPGDIFSIELENQEYAFGRVLTKVSIGHCIEIFDHIGNSSDDYINIDKNKRLMHPQIIDSHSLFWLRNEGRWLIKEFGADDYKPSDTENIKFVYGDKTNRILIDATDKEKEISFEESKKYPSYSPKGDIQIKKIIQFWRDKKND